MATKPVVAVYDTLTQSYNTPIVVTHLSAAQRDFINQVTDENINHAIDLELHHIGTWDDETGVMTANNETPKRLVRAIDHFTTKGEK